MTECIVVGAGIAGLSAAWYLQERGVSVTVVDRAGAGQAASWGNAGQVNPAFTVPLPAPGQVRYALRSVVDRRGSLLIPLTLDPTWW
ncbi:MAG TPA: FAD-dependent oxidoreductase, partial [Ruania sp.]|nr:FAD-dependent oxidoreductase [Ruania sp.]